MIKACKGASSSPTGGRIRWTIASRMSSTPKPVLAEARMASWASTPMMSSISAMTRSGSA